MTLKEFYEQIDGSYEDTLHRLPSEALVHRFVLKYPADPSFAQLREAVAAADWESAFRAAHTLKGVAQNLGFDALYRAASALTEHLRGGQPLTEPQLLDATAAEHERVMSAIEALGYRNFAYEINGLQIFAMGADYIPEDNILTRQTRERTDLLLKSAQEANFRQVGSLTGAVAS